ncbi:MAG: two-component sensor histidine kinase, partial [Tolypothrix sp. T3-bin4]|nr:two-component sensor histidine kinase [Tolypothrix sp. T3-bin4]
MHPHNSCLLLKKKTKAVQPQSIRRLSSASTPEIWINRLTRHWSIHKKIGFGYFLAVSIAVLGTGVGLVVGEHYDDQAVNKFRAAQERYERMDELEKAILEVNLYQQRLIFEPNNLARQQEEIDELMASIDEARKFIAELKADLKKDDTIPQEYAFRLKRLLQTYDTELKSYTLLVQLLSNKLEDNDLTIAEIQAEKKRLGMTNQGEVIPKFKKLSRSLEELVDSNSAQREQAREKFRAAKLWRVTIIVASMVLSMAIAVALAYYT